MRQRVALMRTLVVDPEIVVMTRRPGRITPVHDVKLPSPRDVISLRATDESARGHGRIPHVPGEEFSASASGPPRSEPGVRSPRR